jgi:hypothetical protein
MELLTRISAVRKGEASCFFATHSSREDTEEIPLFSEKKPHDLCGYAGEIASSGTSHRQAAILREQ